MSLLTNYFFANVHCVFYTLKIRNKDGEKASFLNLALQRIIELPILVVKNKQSFFDKVLRISNNIITPEDTKEIDL